MKEFERLEKFAQSILDSLGVEEMIKSVCALSNDEVLELMNCDGELA